MREADGGPCATDPLDSVTLRDALRSLPDEQREVVVLRHVVGLSPGEIAGRMGRTESSVHGLHHRGRGAMRAALLKVGAAPTVMAS
jgi:RNA polymerase sigma-70 factor (ECF subfamily)